VNKTHCLTTLIDSGNNTFGLIEEPAVRRAGIPRIRLEHPIRPAAWNAPTDVEIREVAILPSLDIGGHHTRLDRMFCYIVPKIYGEHNLILGRPFMKLEDAQIDDKKNTLSFRRTGVTIMNLEEAAKHVSIQQISARGYMFNVKGKSPQVFSVTMADIEKALKVVENTDPRTKLLKVLEP
jgi:hypothetical protein